MARNKTNTNTRNLIIQDVFEEIVCNKTKLIKEFNESLDPAVINQLNASELTELNTALTELQKITDLTAIATHNIDNNLLKTSLTNELTSLQTFSDNLKTLNVLSINGKTTVLDFTGLYNLLCTNFNAIKSELEKTPNQGLDLILETSNNFTTIDWQVDDLKELNTYRKEIRLFVLYSKLQKTIFIDTFAKFLEIINKPENKEVVEKYLNSAEKIQNTADLIISNNYKSLDPETTIGERGVFDHGAKIFQKQYLEKRKKLLEIAINSEGKTIEDLVKLLQKLENQSCYDFFTGQEIQNSFTNSLPNFIKKHITCKKTDWQKFDSIVKDGAINIYQSKANHYKELQETFIDSLNNAKYNISPSSNTKKDDIFFANIRKNAKIIYEKLLEIQKNREEKLNLCLGKKTLEAQDQGQIHKMFLDKIKDHNAISSSEKLALFFEEMKTNNINQDKIIYDWILDPSNQEKNEIDLLGEMFHNPIDLSEELLKYIQAESHQKNEDVKIINYLDNIKEIFNKEIKHIVLENAVPTEKKAEYSTQEATTQLRQELKNFYMLTHAVNTIDTNPRGAEAIILNNKEICDFINQENLEKIKKILNSAKKTTVQQILSSAQNKKEKSDIFKQIFNANVDGSDESDILKNITKFKDTNIMKNFHDQITITKIESLDDLKDQFENKIKQENYTEIKSFVETYFSAKNNLNNAIKVNLEKYTNNVKKQFFENQLKPALKEIQEANQELQDNLAELNTKFLPEKTADIDSIDNIKLDTIVIEKMAANSDNKELLLLQEINQQTKEIVAEINKIKNNDDQKLQKIQNDITQKIANLPNHIKPTDSSLISYDNQNNQIDFQFDGNSELQYNQINNKISEIYSKKTKKLINDNKIEIFKNLLKQEVKKELLEMEKSYQEIDNCIKEEKEEVKNNICGLQNTKDFVMLDETTLEQKSYVKKTKILEKTKAANTKLTEKQEKIKGNINAIFQIIISEDSVVSQDQSQQNQQIKDHIMQEIDTTFQQKITEVENTKAYLLNELTKYFGQDTELQEANVKLQNEKTDLQEQNQKLTQQLNETQQKIREVQKELTEISNKEQGSTSDADKKLKNMREQIGGVLGHTINQNKSVKEIFDNSFSNKIQEIMGKKYDNVKSFVDAITTTIQEFSNEPRLESFKGKSLADILSQLKNTILTDNQMQEILKLQNQLLEKDAELGRQAAENTELAAKNQELTEQLESNKPDANDQTETKKQYTQKELFAFAAVSIAIALAIQAGIKHINKKTPPANNPKSSLKTPVTVQNPPSFDGYADDQLLGDGIPA